MATIKLTMDNQHIHADGRYPIIFRLTSKQKSASIYTGIKLFQNEWDNIRTKVIKPHPNFKNLNIILQKKQYELESKLLGLGTSADQLSIQELKIILLNNGEHVKVNFYDFALQEIRALKDQNRFGNANAYETAVNRFIKFTGKDITLDKITYNIISDFDTALLKEGISRNSLAVYMREIRALINKAIKKELMDRSKYPFVNYKIKTESTISRTLKKEDLDRIKSLPLIEGSPKWHSRNIFFLIFNLIGISFIDLALLKPSSIQHGRVVYRRRKTGKIYSIKITPEAQRIINLYQNPDNEYLISYINIGDVLRQEEKKAIHLKLHICNEHLKKIGKELELPLDLTTYVARYSWANVAKSLGYPKDQIAEALGHSYGNRVTGIYLDNYGSEIIDEMNEKVTGVL